MTATLTASRTPADLTPSTAPGRVVRCCACPDRHPPPPDRLARRALRPAPYCLSGAGDRRGPAQARHAAGHAAGVGGDGVRERRQDPALDRQSGAAVAEPAGFAGTATERTSTAAAGAAGQRTAQPVPPVEQPQPTPAGPSSRRRPRHRFRSRRHPRSSHRRRRSLRRRPAPAPPAPQSRRQPAPPTPTPSGPTAGTDARRPRRSQCPRSARRRPRPRQRRPRHRSPCRYRRRCRRRRRLRQPRLPGRARQPGRPPPPRPGPAFPAPMDFSLGPRVSRTPSRPAAPARVARHASTCRSRR